MTPFEVVKIRLQQQKGMCKDTMKYHVRHRVVVGLGGRGGGFVPAEEWGVDGDGPEPVKAGFVGGTATRC